MWKTRTVLSSAAILASLLPACAYAQRGLGDPAGVVRQGLTPELVTLSGKIAAIETQPCQKTTGGGVLGTHLVLSAKGGEKWDVDLGWAPAVAFLVEQLSVGRKVSVTAFRTDKMPEGRYVAKSVSFGGQTVSLRDDTLRPIWAGGRGAGWGGRTGAGYGGGRGPGGGRGWGGGRGPGWGPAYCPRYGWTQSPLQTDR